MAVGTLPVDKQDWNSKHNGDGIVETMFFSKYGGYPSGPDDIFGFYLPTDLQYFRHKVDAVSYSIASSPWMDVVKKNWDSSFVAKFKIISFHFNLFLLNTRHQGRQIVKSVFAVRPSVKFFAVSLINLMTIWYSLWLIAFVNISFLNFFLLSCTIL